MGKVKKILVKNKYFPYVGCLLTLLVGASFAFVLGLTGAAESGPISHLIFKTAVYHALICWTVTALFLVFLLLFVRVESDQAKMNKK